MIQESLVNLGNATHTTRCSRDAYGRRGREVTPPSLQTPKVQKDGEGKPGERTEEFLTIQVHLAVPGKDRHQVHLRTDVAGRAQDSHQEALSGFELSSAP